MPGNDIKSRYSFYNVKKTPKKNVIRTLNNLTVYEFILKKDEVNKSNIEIYRLEGHNHETVLLYGDYVFKKYKDITNLSNSEIVIDELENMILSIKLSKITKIKEFIGIVSYGTNKNSTDLFNPLKEKYHISELSEYLNVSNRYSNSIYNQLKNRVLFRRFDGLYEKPNNVEKESKRLIPSQLDSFEELKVIHNYINRMEWLFNNYLLSEFRDRKKEEEKLELEKEKYLISIKEIDKIITDLSIDINLLLDTDDILYKDAIQQVLEYAHNMYDSKFKVADDKNIKIKWDYDFSDLFKKLHDDENSIKFNHNEIHIKTDEIDVVFPEYTFRTVDEFAIEYINKYNDINKNKYDIFYKSVSGEDDLSYEDEFADSVIEKDEYYQDKKKFFDNTFSSEQQIDFLYETTKYDDRIINYYKNVMDFVDESFEEYEKLSFSDKGSLLRDKYYRSVDNQVFDELKKSDKNYTNKEIKKIKFQIMKVKRNKWNYLYTFIHTPIMQKLKYFDIENFLFLDIDKEDYMLHKNDTDKYNFLTADKNPFEDESPSKIPENQSNLEDNPFDDEDDTDMDDCPF